MNNYILVAKIFQIVTVLLLVSTLIIHNVDTNILSAPIWLVVDIMIFISLLLTAVLQFQNRSLMIASIVSMIILIGYYIARLPDNNCNWWLADGIFITVLYWSITST